MITIDDIDDAFNIAQVEANRIVNEALKKYMAPEVERAGLILWTELPDDVREQIRASRPDLAKLYDNKLKQVRK
jgi:hypothetical protein